jgi:hypothetical protein
LARTGRSDFADLRRLRPDSSLIQELKTLTREEARLIVSQTRLVNQLTACLKTYYPLALTLFSKLQRPSTLAFLQAYPTPQAAAQASRQDITLVLKQAKHRRLARVGQRLWEHLRQPSLQADAITTHVMRNEVMEELSLDLEGESNAKLDAARRCGGRNRGLWSETGKK